MLEKAGAKVPEEFKIDAAQLERFAGRYKNAGGNELVVVVNGARLAIGPRRRASGPASRARGERRDDVPRHRHGRDVNRIQDRGGQGHRLHAHAASGGPGRLHADGGKVMMRRNLLTAFGCLVLRSLALGAALAGVPRRERRRRRRR